MRVRERRERDMGRVKSADSSHSEGKKQSVAHRDGNVLVGDNLIFLGRMFLDVGGREERYACYLGKFLWSGNL